MTPDRILTRDEAFSPIVPPLTIELTSRCNLKCPYCANPSLKRSYGEMPLDLIFRLAEECAASSHRVMAVHGIGEPLLRKDLEVILARFRDLGIWQGWISTNGAILSVRRMGTLVEAGLKGLYVSIDTLDADMYRRTRGGRLAKTIENIRQCAAAHPNIPFVIGLMSHREQVIDSTTLDLFYDLFSATPNVHHHSYENMRFPQAAEDWRRIDPATGRRIEFEQCDQWAYHFTVAIDGRVSLCCVDQEVEHQIGDVTKERISDIWLRASTQNLFRSISFGLSDCPAVCKNCVLKPSTRRLDDVDPALSKPYSELVKAAADAEASGRSNLAIELLRHLQRRDPWNSEWPQRLDRLGVTAEPTIFASAAREREARAKQPPSARFVPSRIEA